MKSINEEVGNKIVFFHILFLQANIYHIMQTEKSLSLSQLHSPNTYRLVSNIRRTCNIRRTPTLGNSQLEFSPTISLAKTSNTRRTLSFDSWVSIVDKMRSRPTWSELLRVAWDFDSPWIKGPITPYQSRPYARHICSNTCCEALWLNCNRISFNRSKNMTPSPPIPRSAAPFCLLSKYPYRQITKDFAMRHDENYVE